MIDFDIRISRNLMTPALKRIRQQLEQMPQQLHQEMVKLTPEDSGNAKRKTKLVNRRRIEARYSYAKVLNKGRHMTRKGMRGSLQAPQGMTGPLREWYRNSIRRLLRARR
jgi:hypothetical protein